MTSPQVKHKQQSNEAIHSAQRFVVFFLAPNIKICAIFINVNYRKHLCIRGVQESLKQTRRQRDCEWEQTHISTQRWIYNHDHLLLL